jgi:hypothetical protein
MLLHYRNTAFRSPVSAGDRPRGAFMGFPASCCRALTILLHRCTLESESHREVDDACLDNVRTPDPAPANA